MNLKDFIENPKLAFAKAVYDAKPETSEEMLKVLEAVFNEQAEFMPIISAYTEIATDIEKEKNDLSANEKRFERVLEFQSSRVATLIEQFTQNNTEALMIEIEKEIEESGNPFRIYIYKPGASKGERMYGIPDGPAFVIQDIDTCYKFDDFDIQNDIDRIRNRIEFCTNDLSELNQEKASLIEKYGEILLTISSDWLYTSDRFPDSFSFDDE